MSFFMIMTCSWLQHKMESETLDNDHIHSVSEVEVNSKI